MRNSEYLAPVARVPTVVMLACAFLVGCGVGDDTASDLSRSLEEPARVTVQSTAPTTTTPPTTTTTLAPELNNDGEARALITETDVVVPVLETLGPNRWLVRTTCQNLAVVTAGGPIDTVHVVLDPGHGGSERGAVTNSGLEEAAVNFAVATRVEAQLTELGFSVLLTRYADDRVPIVTRAEIGDSLEAGLLVSIHHQGTEPVPFGPEPGTEVFYQQNSDESRRFAGLLREEAIQALGDFDIEWFNGVDAGATYRLNSETKIDFYGMIRRPAVPAVLAEMSFLGNPAEEQLLGTAAFLDAESQAITNAIVRYFSTDDPGSGWVEPSFELSSDAGSGTTDGCEDPDLGPTAPLPIDLDPADYVVEDQTDSDATD